MNTQTTLPQAHVAVKRQPQDKINLARSRGEYVPKVTRNAKKMLEWQKPKSRNIDDELMWA